MICQQAKNEAECFCLWKQSPGRALRCLDNHGRLVEVPEEWNSAGKGSKGEIDRPQDQREHEEGAWFMGLMAFRCTQQPARRIVLGEFESLGVSSHQSRFRGDKSELRSRKQTKCSWTLCPAV